VKSPRRPQFPSLTMGKSMVGVDMREVAVGADVVVVGGGGMQVATFGMLSRV
jgi:hypothetical protein